ncbi:MAG: hypothetical protein OD815_001414 [Candidatus Alkanophagales archaeon MCA70_species_2]|nr:hypothetical protein [Candidatus Alkanophaga liquidiphilum]
MLSDIENLLKVMINLIFKLPNFLHVRRLTVLAAVAGLAIATILVIGILMLTSQQENSAEALLISSKDAVKSLHTLRAEAYTSKDVKTPTAHERAKYVFSVEFASDLGTRISFNDFKFEYEGENEETMERVGGELGKTLDGAWLLEKGEYYWLYTPAVAEHVVEYKTGSGLLRYEFLPIFHFDVAELFSFAENPRYLGTEPLNIGNDSVEAHVVEFDLPASLIPWRTAAVVKVWISAADRLPLRVVVTSKYENTDITLEFGCTSYEKDVSVPPGHFEIPEGLFVVRRY